MKNKRNLLMFLMNAWLFLAYYTVTHFNWWVLIPTIWLFPFWKEIKLWLEVQTLWRKSGKQQEIDQIEKEIEEENNN